MGTLSPPALLPAPGATNTSANLTASDVTEMLRAHYLPESRPPSGAFVQEIESPSGRRRADALWVPLTRAGGTGIIGHEVKVSRADVLAELADPTKAEDWSRYCTRWWLTISDPRLVDGLDVPEAWGIMSPPSGRRRRSMTILREAPKLTPDEPGVAFRRVLSAVHFREQDQIRTLKHEAKYEQEKIQRLERQLEEARLNAAGAYVSTDARRAVAIVSAVEKASVDGENTWFRIGQDNVTDQDFIDALINLGRTRHATQMLGRELDRLIRSTRDLVDPFASVLKILEQTRVPSTATPKELARAH